MAYKLLPEDAPTGGYKLLPADAPRQQSAFETVRNGLATAPINAYLGVRQMFGGLSPIQQNVLEQNKEAERKAPFSSFASNVLTMAPAAFIPGANTVAGAGVVGGAMGMMQPVQGDQTLGNIAGGKALNTGVGTLAGMGSQALANRLASFLQGRAANAATSKAAEASRNSVRDQTLAAGRSAGYVVPNSEIRPSFIGNQAESFAGKDALKQEMTHQNQQVTNLLARRALGLPDDAPISVANLDALKSANWKAYQDIANLPVTPSQPAVVGSIVNQQGVPMINTPAKAGFNPRQALEDLKQLRHESKAQFNFYNRSANPEALAKAKELRAAADALETQFTNYAASAGRPDLVPALQAARVNLAKIGTVERAVNESTGDISARVLGRMLDKGQLLTGDLKTIGQFNNGFSKFMGEGVKTPNAGSSATNLMMSALLGIAGGSSMGPAGAMIGAAPFARGGVRSLLTSQAMQSVPRYQVPMLTRAAGNVTPEMLAVINRAAIPYALPRK